MKKKAVFITNIPSPYRVDFFSYMQKNFPEYEFHIIFSGAGMENRKWSVEMEEIEHYHFLKSKTIIIRKRFDDRYVFIPVGVEKTLNEIAPDVVFAMEYNPTILRAVHWCRKKKIPFISWTDGTLNSEKNIGKVQRLSRSYIIKRAAAFIASSTASREAQIAYGADEKKCFISYLTVDIQKYLYEKPQKTTQNEGLQLLYVGSLIQRKGLDLLLPALAKTPQNIRLWIVGEEYNPTILRAVHWCRKKKIPFISWTDGTLNSEKNIGKVQRLSRSYIIKRAAAFIASSTASREAQIAYGADEKKCFISYLTVDIQKYLYEKPQKTTQNEGLQLLYVGSLIQRKGLDLLLPALAKTPQNIRLWIVGEGQEKDLLQKQCTELKISDRVEFLGYQEGEPLQKLYRTADAFVLPTREDCFGLVLLEAMCASLPIISSKYADGARDLVSDGENGYIIDPEDVDGFAEAIQKAAAGDMASVMGKKSYEKAHEFSFEQVSKGCIAALSYVLSQK